MKGMLWIFLAIFLIPFALGDAEFSGSLKGYYNIGDKIPVEVLLSNAEPGLLKASIDCNSKSVLYFVTPIDSSSPSKITVPEYTASASLAGNCHITISIDSLDGNTKSERSSSSFEITNEIVIEGVADKLEYKPGETIKISGSARKKSGMQLKNATLSITLDNDVKSIDAKEGFSYSLPLKTDTKSGKREILLRVQDGYANEGSVKIPILIMQRATTIEVSPQKKEYSPKDTVEFKVVVYDQAKDAMEIPVKIDIKDPSGATLQSLEIRQGISAFTLDDFAVPGTYTIKASSSGISQEGRFYVRRVVMIESRYDDQKVIIKNIGNVPYENKTTLILSGNGKNIVLTKDISLNPGESAIIDLTKEVPGGIYSLTLPEDSIEGNEDTVKDISIQDNRPLSKKIRQGLFGITGATVAETSWGLKIAPYMLIIIVVGIIVYYIPKDKIRKLREKIKIPRLRPHSTSSYQKYINNDVLGRFKR